MTSKFSTRQQSSQTTSSKDQIQPMALYRQPSTRKEVRRLERSVSRIERAMKPETKWWSYGMTTSDTVVNQLTNVNWLSTTPVITLNQPIQGTADFQRVGDSIYIKKLLLYGTYKPNVFLDVSDLRIIVLWDESNIINAATDVLEAHLFGSTQVHTGPKRRDQRFNSKILLDHRIAANDGQWNATNFSTRHHHFELSVDVNKHTQFVIDLPTITTGAIKMFFTSGTNPSYNGVVDWQSRILYTDS